MEEKRKKFGMEILPSLHKQAKQAALDQGIPLWMVTERAFRGLLPPNEGSVTEISPDIAESLVQIRYSLGAIASQAQSLTQELSALLGRQKHGGSVGDALRASESSIATLKESGERIVRDAAPIRSGRKRRVGGAGSGHA
jgi:hypothetical protein